MKSNLDLSLVENIQSPFFIFYPEKLIEKVNIFNKNFVGDVLYSLKANSSRFIIKLLYRHGIKSFDVASIKEIKLIRETLPSSNIFFMNPIKSREAIFEAYNNYNVKNFSVDSYDEFKKIQDETKFANDLIIHLRIKVPNISSAIKLSNKFGVDEKEAPLLLKKIKNTVDKVGMSFHVGSQCMDPSSFNVSIQIAKKIIALSQVKIDYFNVGGGFPSKYLNYNSKPLIEYFSEIDKCMCEIKNYCSTNFKLLAEPGRSIVSDCMSTIVKVNLRKNDKLFINDGIHGSLNNAGDLNFIYPVELFNRNDELSKQQPFSFYGPTCDSKDFMKGPFFLPGSINEGDSIQIFQTGAYSTVFQTDFNGFYETPKVFQYKKLSHDIIKLIQIK